MENRPSTLQSVNPTIDELYWSSITFEEFQVFLQSANPIKQLLY